MEKLALALAFIIDQHEKYGHLDAEWFEYNIGRLPEMIAYSLGKPETPLADSMVKSYGFNPPPMEGGTVLADGVYSYPEDPLLYPFAKCATDRGDFFIYPYGIVCIAEHEKTPVIYRFD